MVSEPGQATHLGGHHLKLRSKSKHEDLTLSLTRELRLDASAMTIDTREKDTASLSLVRFSAYA